MKPAHVLTIAFLSLVAAGHALRLLFGWVVVVNQVTVAMWPSVVAIVVTLGLATALWRESRATRPAAA
jgi:hypothetical protein